MGDTYLSIDTYGQIWTPLTGEDNMILNRSTIGEMMSISEPDEEIMAKMESLKGICPADRIAMIELIEL